MLLTATDIPHWPTSHKGHFCLSQWVHKTLYNDHFPLSSRLLLWRATIPPQKQPPCNMCISFTQILPRPLYLYRLPHVLWGTHVGGPRGYSGFQVTGMPDWTIFLGRKIGQVFFWGGLIKVGILLVIYNNLKIHGVVPAYPGCIVLRVKYNQIK